MTQQNIAVKLCGILQAQGDEVVTAQEWRLIGQEQDGSQLLTWVSTIDGKEVLNLGVYTNKTKTLSTLHTFEQKLNIIQASVNPTHSLLSYVVKVFPDDPNDTEPQYWPYLISLLPDKEQHPVEVEDFSTKQIMVQYVYGKSNKYSPGIRNDRLLLFKHLEYIKIYRTPMFLNECDDGSEKWGFDGIYPEPETIVKVFSWAQWDCANQILYYIHYRHPAQSFAEGEEVKSPTEMTPTLSAFQFHADLPHETVLNIPLSLPHACGSGAACGAYEDDPVPLRVHDCSLDLTILCDQRGMVAICHHYLYKALDDSATSLVADDVSGLKDGGVNFAYSITLLHHGRVLHAAVPDLPWSLAKSLRPSYLIYEENHLLVNIPRLYTHLVDISLHHEPCCHIVLATEWSETGPTLAPLLGWGSHAMVDLNTLDVVCLAVTDKDITAAFKSDSTVDNRLAIMHYLIQHAANLDLAEELVGWMCLNQRERSSVGSMERVMQEYLVAAAYQATRRSLPASAAALAELLPFTQHVAFSDARAGSRCVSVSVERLWNSSAVVLAPRQRVCQFAEDAWTRVWRALAKPARRRLEPATVRAKLRAGLQCYRPEALSRATTPLSPAAPPPLAARALDPLPFFEVDLCTASRQELVVAANLREVSVHLMREGAEEGKGGASEGKGGAAEGSVHAVATRWVAAQLDASRALCRLLCRALALTPAHHHQRGFALIDALEEGHARVLCHVLQQFQTATEGVAFPLPQGFASFATYLAYRALPLQRFMQHVHRGLFELHVDALKAIVAEGGEVGEARVDAKLRLVQLAGEGRGRRALAAWAHRAALVLRAQDHAAALLSGGGRAASARCARPPAPPAAARLSPLDTFLDLLTAKASLHELDFNLIIEATLASLHRSV